MRKKQTTEFENIFSIILFHVNRNQNDDGDEYGDRQREREEKKKRMLKFVSFISCTLLFVLKCPFIDVLVLQKKARHIFTSMKINFHSLVKRKHQSNVCLFFFQGISRKHLLITQDATRKFFYFCPSIKYISRFYFSSSSFV